MKAILGIEEGVRKAAEAAPKFEFDAAAVELNMVVGREGRLLLVGRGSAGHEATHTVKIYLKPRAAHVTPTDPADRPARLPSGR